MHILPLGYNILFVLLAKSAPPLHTSLPPGISTGGSEVKLSAYNAGDLGSIPGLGRSPGEENGNPLQYSCLENPMDGGAWLDTTERLQFSSVHSSHIILTWITATVS